MKKILLGTLILLMVSGCASWRKSVSEWIYEPEPIVVIGERAPFVVEKDAIFTDNSGYFKLINKESIEYNNPVKKQWYIPPTHLEHNKENNTVKMKQ